MTDRNPSGRTHRLIINPSDEPRNRRDSQVPRDPAMHHSHPDRASGDSAQLTPIHSLYGKGPRNYRRSDPDVLEDVCEALTYDHDVDATNVDVHVHEGEVTLSGTVADRAQKRRAEVVAEQVRGVRDVHNRLTLQGAQADGQQRSMTTGAQPDVLLKLGESNLTPADASMDIRGRKVLDRHGNEIGHVADVLFDPHERKVRFLDVHSGGFLGMGEKRTLIPVDAVTRVDEDAVHVNQTREHVRGAPAYDPQLTERRDEGFYAPYYGYYGYAPFWGAGYAYPPFPHS